MATTTYYQGYEGSVKFHPTGGTAAVVVAVTAWSISISKEIFSTTRVGDSYEKRAGGLISGSGSIELVYTDNAGAIITAVNREEDIGDAVFELYLDSAGTKSITFSGLIDKADYGSSVDDVQRISCTFVTNGTITTNV
jgi:hypothetical protein